MDAIFKIVNAVYCTLCTVRCVRGVVVTSSSFCYLLFLYQMIQ